ncbi:MAG: hypothetical protein Q8S29_09745, partial [Phreatobacter sp.]|nr:hypothetical protein [Phreatobacter sp.]
MRPSRFRLPIAPALALAGLLMAATAPHPAAAQATQMHGAFSLDLLSPAQRTDVMKRVDSYALVEVFLRACGRPPALESRFRRAAAGCIQPQTIPTLTGQYRRALSARGGLRWDCRSANGRRM